MRGGFSVVLLPLLFLFYLLLKKMVMDDVPRWVIHTTIILSSVGIPFGLGWYINGEFLGREEIMRMTMCAGVLFIGLNVVLYAVDKLNEN